MRELEKVKYWIDEEIMEFIVDEYLPNVKMINNIYFQPDDFIWDTPIYKWIKKEYAIEMLKGNISFSSPHLCWEDKYENWIFLKDHYDDKYEQYISTKGLANNLYAQSWTTLKESDALWRIYSDKNKKDCVRIEVSLREMFAWLWKLKIDSEVNDSPYLNWFVGYVQYFNQDTIIENAKSIKNSFFSYPENSLVVQSLLFKRESFAHEKEIRIIYYKKPESNNQRKDIEKYPKFLFKSELIKSIVLDPRLVDDQVETIKEEIISTGYKGSIEKSTLYDLPPELIER